MIKTLQQNININNIKYINFHNVSHPHASGYYYYSNIIYSQTDQSVICKMSVCVAFFIIFWSYNFDKSF